VVAQDQGKTKKLKAFSGDLEESARGKIFLIQKSR